VVAVWQDSRIVCYVRIAQKSTAHVSVSCGGQGLRGVGWCNLARLAYVRLG
jgi:hypothetical protein